MFSICVAYLKLHQDKVFGVHTENNSRSFQAHSDWMGSVCALPSVNMFLHRHSRMLRLILNPDRGCVHSGVGFLQGPLYLSAFILPSILSFPISATENYRHWMILPLPCFTTGIVLIDGVYSEMVVLLAGSHISAEDFWSSVWMATGFLDTFLAKALRALLLNLAVRADVGSVLVVTDIFYWTKMEPIVFLGTFTALEMFLYTCQALSQYNLMQRSTQSSLDFMAWYLDWRALWIVGPYTYRYVPF